jgi:hypothetical protein
VKEALTCPLNVHGTENRKYRPFSPRLKQTTPDGRRERHPDTVRGRTMDERDSKLLASVDGVRKEILDSIPNQNQRKLVESVLT